jgi:hypothetical protein
LPFREKLPATDLLRQKAGPGGQIALTLRALFSQFEPSEKAAWKLAHLAAKFLLRSFSYLLADRQDSYQQML